MIMKKLLWDIKLYSNSYTNQCKTNVYCDTDCLIPSLRPMPNDNQWPITMTRVIAIGKINMNTTVTMTMSIINNVSVTVK